MTSQLKSADSKQIGEDFVPSFDSKTFDLQVPKLDHTMSRRVKEVKGGEAAKTEAKEKSLVSHQFKLLDVSRPLLYLWGAITSDDNLKDTSMAAAAVSVLQL